MIKKSKRDVFISFKVTADEKAEIQRRADEAGMSVSAYARYVAIYQKKE